MKSIFVSYSHADKDVFDRLMVHLKPFKNLANIEVFADTNIVTDEHWRKRIRNEINNASVGILLVSPDFLASDFISEQELPILFAGRRKAKKRLFTVFISPSSYKLHPELSDYQAFNDPKTLVSSLTSHQRDELFVRLCDEIRRIIEDYENDSRRLIEGPATDFVALPEVDYF